MGMSLVYGDGTWRKVHQLGNTLTFSGLRDRHKDYIYRRWTGALFKRNIQIEERIIKNAKFTPQYKSGMWNGMSWHVDFHTSEAAQEFKALFGSESLTRTLDQATTKAREIITKPGLLDHMLAVQRQMVEPEQDGHILLAKMREILIEQGEYDFEQEIKDFPVVIQMPESAFTKAKYKLNTTGDPSPVFKVAEDWLRANVPSDEYLAFPNTACGKYKKCCFNVYFKSATWATYFKIGFDANSI
jgi:hypothetical protein